VSCHHPRRPTGVADVLRNALAPLAGLIRVAFIYGSFARSDENASRDVDLFLVGNAKFGDVVSALGPAQEALGREINPTVYPAAEFRTKMAGGHSFVKQVITGSKVFLIGDEHELARLAGKSLGH